MAKTISRGGHNAEVRRVETWREPGSTWNGYEIPIVTELAYNAKGEMEVAIIPTDDPVMIRHYNQRGMGTECAIHTGSGGTFDPWKCDDEEVDRNVHRWFGGGGLSVLLMSFPVILFNIIWSAAWYLLVLKVFPSAGLEDKKLFYGMALGATQILYIIFLPADGLVAIPATILSFAVLVWMLP